MIRNYFKVAVRNLIKNKGYVIINTLGMGIALACCITAYLLIAYNIEFDDYFDQSKLRNTVKLKHHLERKNGEPYQQLITPMVLPPIAVEEIAGIKRYTRYCSQNGNMSYDEKVFSERISFADADFFEMFDMQLKAGSFKNFKNQKSIFLTEKLAEKYFGEEDPVGKIMLLEFRNKPYEVFVGGVMEKIPMNTTFDFQALMRIENYLDIFEISENDWKQWRGASALFELADIDQRQSISKQLDKYVPIRNEAKTDATSVAFELVPFTQPTTGDEVTWSFLNMRIPSVALLIFITLGGIILLIACFNLTNTTIALTVKRLKEIGVRKVVGALRWQIVIQFLLEITITIALAIVVGLIMARIIVPEFAAMWQLQYGLEDLNGVNLVLALTMLLFVSAILAGAYPALFNSKFKPVVLLKGNLRIKGTSPLTRILLVAQFSLSVIILIAGIIFTQNAEYQKKVSFGYDKENVLTVFIHGEQEFERLKNAIRDNPRIEQMAATIHHFGYGSYNNPVKIDTAESNSHVYEVGAGYFDVMGLELVAGRDFREDSQADLESSAIIDENFVMRHGLENPIDTRIIQQEKTYRVIGVVKNHLSGLFDEIGKDKDHFYRMAKPAEYNHLVVRAAARDILETKDYIEAQWKKTFPSKPFNCELQEDIVYADANSTNRNLTQIFMFLTILGCLLSASGIYSLASLNIEKRTKEIGIRKVFGATVANIVRLINKEFAIILALAMIFGALGGFFLTDALLTEIYTQRIEVGLLTVVLCSLLIFFIGISTTSGTIFRAARANPAQTLKDD